MASAPYYKTPVFTAVPGAETQEAACTDKYQKWWRLLTNDSSRKTMLHKPCTKILGSHWSNWQQPASAIYRKRVVRVCQHPMWMQRLRGQPSTIFWRPRPPSSCTILIKPFFVWFKERGSFEIEIKKDDRLKQLSSSLNSRWTALKIAFYWVQFKGVLVRRGNSWTKYWVEFFGQRLKSSETRVLVGFSTFVFPFYKMLFMNRLESTWVFSFSWTFC
jgi:hypothetical protein